MHGSATPTCFLRVFFFSFWIAPGALFLALRFQRGFKQAETILKGDGLTLFRLSTGERGSPLERLHAHKRAVKTSMFLTPSFSEPASDHNSFIFTPLFRRCTQKSVLFLTALF